MGAGFWTAVFGVAYRLLAYFRGVGKSGRCSPARCSPMVLLAFFAILLLSNLITALSTFFLAQDLDLLVAAPVDWLWLYLAKLVETLVAFELDGGADGGADVHRVRRRCIDGGPLFPLVAIARSAAVFSWCPR